MKARSINPKVAKPNSVQVDADCTTRVQFQGKMRWCPEARQTQNAIESPWHRLLWRHWKWSQWPKAYIGPRLPMPEPKHQSVSKGLWLAHSGRHGLESWTSTQTRVTAVCSWTLLWYADLGFLNLPPKAHLADCKRCSNSKAPVGSSCGSTLVVQPRCQFRRGSDLTCSSSWF